MILSLTCVAVLSINAIPEMRALAFLSREVPLWSVHNKCYSCHNNGDAARALYAAARLKFPISARVLTANNDWLANPKRWSKNGGEGISADQGLARIQFAAALVDAIDAGQVKERDGLLQAAALVAEEQHKDGSWRVDAESLIGSPATYGPVLATYQARRILAQANAAKYRDAIRRTDSWFRQLKVQSVLDAAVILLALGNSDDREAKAQVQAAWKILDKGRSKDGGWGPFANSPPETFDTALVLLALASLPASKETQGLMAAARQFLIEALKPDGSWQETTRPSGAVTYAQRLSTAGWATQALLATYPKRGR